MKEAKNAYLKNLFYFSSAFIVITAMSLLIVGVDVFHILLIPLLFNVFTYKYGYKKALTLVLIALVSILFFMRFNPLALLVTTLFTSAIGITIGESMRRKKQPYEITVQATLLYMTYFLMLTLYIEHVEGIRLMESYKLFLTTFIAEMEPIIASTPDLNINQLEETMLSVLDIIPAIFMMSAFIIAIVLQWVSYKILNRVFKTQYAFPKISTFNLPKLTIWTFLFIIILLTGLEEETLLHIILQNVSIVYYVLFSLQGLSFVFFYLQHKKKKKRIGVIFIIVSLIFLPIGLYVTRILGIIDTGFMLRKRLKKDVL